MSRPSSTVVLISHALEAPAWSSFLLAISGHVRSGVKRQRMLGGPAGGDQRPAPYTQSQREHGSISDALAGSSGAAAAGMLAGSGGPQGGAGIGIPSPSSAVRRGAPAGAPYRSWVYFDDDHAGDSRSPRQGQGSRAQPRPPTLTTRPTHATAELNVMSYNVLCNFHIKSKAEYTKVALNDLVRRVRRGVSSRVSCLVQPLALRS